MSENVVAHLRDGQVIKGVAYDFFHARTTFHLRPVIAAPGTPPVHMHMADLKALFFVKDLKGDPLYIERRSFAPGSARPGHRIAVTFHDGETIVGSCEAYSLQHQGFFLTPADRHSNNERIYVVSSAVRELHPVTE